MKRVSKAISNNRYHKHGKYCHLLIVLLMITAMSQLTGCSQDDEMLEPQPPTTEERVPRYAVMNLEGGVVPFDATTRATTSDWEDEAKIYLQFTVGKKLVDGVATYSSSAQEWSIEFNGELTEGVETKCEAYYFENAGNASFTNVILTEHTAIYIDKEATYLFKDNTLTVTAELMPMVGRLRLKGEAGENYRFSGLKFYNRYDITTNSFISDEKYYISTTQDDGYSDYFYVYFPDEKNREICFDDMASGVSLVRKFGENVLAVGKSGYLNIPTIDKHNGWTILNKDITVSDVTFRMIRVNNPNDSKVPYFYIGETEVTQELWEAVMGADNNPSTFEGENLPVNNINAEYCANFINQLNTMTQTNFRLPTQEEWEYAAKGASASKGYTHSGSNNADDVAWYSENSDETTHPVKTKLPNEIGIYDMSGNVSEYLGYRSVYDNYYSYHYYRKSGGSYDNVASISSSEYQIDKIYNQIANKPTPSKYQYTYLGLRIAVDDIE